MLIQAPNYQAFAASERRSVVLTEEESTLESYLLRCFRNPRLSAIVREYWSPRDSQKPDATSAVWLNPRGHCMRRIRDAVVSTVRRYLPSKLITPHRCGRRHRPVCRPFSALCALFAPLWHNVDNQS